MKLQEVSKELLGTKLIIKAFSKENLEKLFFECFDLAKNFEEKFSRFKSGNLLDKINNSKNWTEIDSDFFKMISFSLKLAETSDGVFDPTVIGILEKNNYGKLDLNLKLSFGYKNILLQNSKIKLLNGSRIELGAVGKGFLIDKLAKKFKGIEKVLINFGGDIFAKGEWEIALENPVDDKIAIGTIKLKDGFLACSGIGKRKIGDFHHLINMKTQKSSTKILATFIEANSGIESDGFATLLNISEKSEIKNYFKENKIEGLVIFKDFNYFLSKKSKINLF